MQIKGLVLGYNGDKWCKGGAKVVQKWCKGGAKVVQITNPSKRNVSMGCGSFAGGAGGAKVVQIYYTPQHLFKIAYFFGTFFSNIKRKIAPKTA